MKVIYFAWLRKRTGIAEEEVNPPVDVKTVAELVEWLKTRSPGHGEAFANTEAVQCAVNHEFAEFDDPVAPQDEIAFFPPVTGG